MNPRFQATMLILIYKKIKFNRNKDKMTKYKDFVKSTGYGTGGGLCGWNCRHSFIPFDPETMENNLKKYGLEENKKMYENHQKQRF